VRVPDGEHVVVLGPARSGRTTALVTFTAAWRAVVRDGVVLVVSPRGGPWSPDVVVDVGTAAARLDRLAGGSRALLVVDDAERVDDARLGALAAERRPGVLVVAAGRPDALRSLYGHWTTVVRRSRTGVLMAACADIDGDLVGELLPRRPPIPARPGLAWIVDGAGRRLAQLAS
jgi:S-DNA-T family DNA segregation ATPase FtsK/SpoIIIE